MLQPLIFLLMATIAIADTQFSICDFREAVPELYYSYGTNECPPAFYMSPNGDCAGYQIDKLTCASFCQLRTKFYYGQEQPFTRIPICRGGDTCRITETVHQAYGWKKKVNGNFKQGALTLGVTGGYKDISGIAQAYSITKILPEHTCGYWTFVPYVREACGTYSEAAIIKGECDHPFQTTPNACVEQPVQLVTDDKLPDMRVLRGIIVFVYVDCKTSALLPDEKQDPAFAQPGVKLPRHYKSAYDAYYKDQGAGDLSVLVKDKDAKCKSKDSDRANASDCNDAITMLLDDPGKDVDYRTKLVVSSPFLDHFVIYFVNSLLIYRNRLLAIVKSRRNSIRLGLTPRAQEAT